MASAVDGTLADALLAAEEASLALSKAPDRRGRGMSLVCPFKAPLRRGLMRPPSLAVRRCEIS